MEFFISHASEDKDAIARPLALELRERGYKVWYDEFTLTLGDSLRESIDKGLSETRYGIVILSPDFMSKNWPREELDGLYTRQTSSGKKVILPVWHNITQHQLASFSPMLADKLGVTTSSGFNNVVDQIVRVIDNNLGNSTIVTEFKEIIERCASNNIRKYAKCTLELTLTSFDGYDISELYPMYRNHFLSKSINGFNMIIPPVLHPSCNTSNSPDIVFDSVDYHSNIVNHFFYDKLVMTGNRLRYSTIELADLQTMLINTSILMLNMLYLMIMLERLHEAESKDANIILDFRIDAPQKTIFNPGNGSLFDVTYMILHAYSLQNEVSNFNLQFSDLGSNNLFRFVNRVYSLFRDESSKTSEPFLRIERNKFEEQFRLIKSNITYR